LVLPIFYAKQGRRITPRRSRATGVGSGTVTGTEADINAAPSSLMYPGDNGFTGDDTLTATSTDPAAATDIDSETLAVVRSEPDLTTQKADPRRRGRLSPFLHPLRFQVGEHKNKVQLSLDTLALIYDNLPNPIRVSLARLLLVSFTVRRRLE
jgi:hypothetical protein